MRAVLDPRRSRWAYIYDGRGYLGTVYRCSAGGKCVAHVIMPGGPGGYRWVSAWVDAAGTRLDGPGPAGEYGPLLDLCREAGLEV